MLNDEAEIDMILEHCQQREQDTLPLPVVARQEKWPLEAIAIICYLAIPPVVALVIVCLLTWG